MKGMANTCISSTNTSSNGSFEDEEVNDIMQQHDTIIMLLQQNNAPQYYFNSDPLLESLELVWARLGSEILSEQDQGLQILFELTSSNFTVSSTARRAARIVLFGKDSAEGTLFNGQTKDEERLNESNILVKIQAHVQVLAFAKDTLDNRQKKCFLQGQSLTAVVIMAQSLLMLNESDMMMTQDEWLYSPHSIIDEFFRKLCKARDDPRLRYFANDILTLFGGFLTPY